MEFSAAGGRKPSGGVNRYERDPRLRHGITVLGSVCRICDFDLRPHTEKLAGDTATFTI